MEPMGAVIFDMDGVIVNSEPLHERAFLEVVAELGYGHDLGLRFADYVGRSDHELWVDFIAKHRPPHSLAELLARKRQRMIEVIRQTKPVFPGLPQLVAKLAQRYRLAVASGSDRMVIDAVLELDDLRRRFPVVVSAAEVPRGKPAPDIFLRGAKLLGVRPAACWVIEDSKPGVAAGLAAGMRVIAVANTHPADELHQAHHVVHTCVEIERLLLPV
jgi:beta-phosphoglucomutase-like phosphatase (HAD superfamily)